MFSWFVLLAETEKVGAEDGGELALHAVRSLCCSVSRIAAAITVLRERLVGCKHVVQGTLMATWCLPPDQALGGPRPQEPGVLQFQEPARLHSSLAHISDCLHSERVESHDTHRGTET